MSVRTRYLKLVANLLPAGAFGLSAALAATAAQAHTTEGVPSGATSQPLRVADQLQAIRDAVSSAAAEGHVRQVEDNNVKLSWWLNGNGRGWGNGGRVWGNGGHPGWGNGGVGWHNGWGNGWGNGGWHNWRNWHN